MSAQGNCLFLGTPEDKPYLPYLKGMFNGRSTYTICDPVSLLAELELYCSKRGITAIVSTSVPILTKLLAASGKSDSRKAPSLSNYAGSVFTHKGIEIVFIEPISQLLTVSYSKFITARHISKVVSPDSWAEATSFVWSLCDSPSKLESAYHDLSSAFLISCDIETTRVNLAIRCVGYTGLYRTPSNGIESRSYVIPLDSSFNLAYVRKINALDISKVFQNGKYDNTYFLRYNAPCARWIWDTAHQFHSWYSELPKDLAFLNAFFLRKVVYWKDLAETQDLYEYYKYNALDTWATANVCIQWILRAPDWAKRNYALEFPLVFPCLLAEMTGLKRDPERLLEARKEVDEEESSLLSSLRSSLGVAGFNPGSPVQVKTLLKVLGCGDITSTNEKDLKKAILRHPLNARLLGERGILGIRGLRKLATTYLRVESDADKDGEKGAKEYRNRVLYALNPHGTDTGRLASREHHFWCGLQIQNIPRGPEVKKTLCADEGFYLAECDLEQAESRDTAHISGDEALIAAVSGTRDFHSVNASSFFGVSYESIYDDSAGKTRDKALRDLAKRVNHGANYNMGPGVLIDTMGIDKIREAGRLLHLPFNDLKKIAEYLLAQFHKTYPRIKDSYYVSVVNEIGISSRLVSRAFHHTVYNLGHYRPDKYIEQGDWTRYCFGKPDKNKLDLNALVAHCPQSLNARTLNEAFMRVFYEVALPNPEIFRLHAQIHDSILFSYKRGHADLADKVQQCMEIACSVRDVSGVTRTFTVPAALKMGKKDKEGNFKPAIYWDQTE